MNNQLTLGALHNTSQLFLTSLFSFLFLYFLFSIFQHLTFFIYYLKERKKSEQSRVVIIIHLKTSALRFSFFLHNKFFWLSCCLIGGPT